MWGNNYEISTQSYVEESTISKIQYFLKYTYQRILILIQGHDGAGKSYILKSIAKKDNIKMIDLNKTLNLNKSSDYHLRRQITQILDKKEMKEDRVIILLNLDCIPKVLIAKIINILYQVTRAIIVADTSYQTLSELGLRNPEIIKIRNPKITEIDNIIKIEGIDNLKLSNKMISENQVNLNSLKEETEL
jgi:adenylate kinase family enzyme